MRTANQGVDDRAVSWKALPAENRHRIARILALALAERLRAPAERNDDSPGGPGESG